MLQKVTKIKTSNENLLIFDFPCISFSCAGWNNRLKLQAVYTSIRSLKWPSHLHYPTQTFLCFSFTVSFLVFLCFNTQMSCLKMHNIFFSINNYFFSENNPQISMVEWIWVRMSFRTSKCKSRYVLLSFLVVITGIFGINRVLFLVERWWAMLWDLVYQLSKSSAETRVVTVSWLVSWCMINREIQIQIKVHFCVFWLRTPSFFLATLSFK